MIKTKPKDIGPEGLINAEIISNLEEVRRGIMRIILAYDGHQTDQKEICRTLNIFIYDWVIGIGAPMLLTTGHADFFEKENEYQISLLIDSRELLCLGEPDYDEKRVNYSYRIGQTELREFKIDQVIS